MVALVLVMLYLPNTIQGQEEQSLFLYLSEENETLPGSFHTFSWGLLAITGPHAHSPATKEAEEVSVWLQ